MNCNQTSIRIQAKQLPNLTTSSTCIATNSFTSASRAECIYPLCSNEQGKSIDLLKLNGKIPPTSVSVDDPPVINGSTACSNKTIRFVRVSTTGLPTKDHHRTFKVVTRSPVVRPSVPCRICHEITTNLVSAIPFCSRCQLVFHRFFLDLEIVHQTCTCDVSAVSCVSCRLIKAAEIALSKWGISLTDRAKLQWSILDDSLDALSKTGCTLEDIIRVHEDLSFKLHTQRDVNTSSPRKKTCRNRSRSNQDSIPTGSFKRRAVDPRSWVNANLEQLNPLHSMRNSGDCTLSPALPPVSVDCDSLTDRSVTSVSSEPVSIYSVNSSLSNGDDGAVDFIRLLSPTKPCSTELSSLQKSLNVSTMSWVISPISVQLLTHVPPQPSVQPTIIIQTCNDGPSSGQISSLSELMTNSSVSSATSDPVTVSNSNTECGRRESAPNVHTDNRSPIAILPRPTTEFATVYDPDLPGYASSETEVFARRICCVIKPYFKQVFDKHQQNVKSQPTLVELAVSNHATLFRLFGFIDWEWNNRSEISPVVRQSCWSTFHQQFNECLTDMVRFIKRIPGFALMKPQDRILLVRNNAFELAFMVHYLYWYTEFGAWHGSDNCILTLDQLVVIFPRGVRFFPYAFANAKRLSQFARQFHHMGLLAALVVLNPDFPNLLDRRIVEELQEKMICAVKCNLDAKFDDSDKLLSQLLHTLVCLRRMGNEHRVFLESLQETESLIFPDDLYSELFGLVPD